MTLTALKEVYEPQSVHKAFYTGGAIQWTTDGESLLCHCGNIVNIIDVNQGVVTGKLGDEETGNEDEVVDEITTFCLGTDDKCVATAHRSGLLKLWSLQDKSLVKHWKSIHKGPISKLVFSPNNEILASGGSDSSIRLWDLRFHHCTHNLTGISGVVSILKFHQHESDLFLFGAADDTTIKSWNCAQGISVLSLSGHYSRVTGIDITADSKHIVSCSRDKVLILWDFESGHQLKVIPLYECVEGLALLPSKIKIPGPKLDESVFVATGGERGVIRIWDVLVPKEVYVQTNSLISEAKPDVGIAISNILFNKATKAIAVSSFDQNIILHDLKTFGCKKQLIGFTDEVLSIVFVGSDESLIAVATNSPDVKLYKLDSMNCQLLRGHTDIVLSLATSKVNPNLFASSAKDNSIRVWLLDDDDVNAHCVGSAVGHSNSVSAITFSLMNSKYLFSGSLDTTLKMWKLPSSFKKGEMNALTVKSAKVAHDKDINDVAVSPNDKIIATGSLDKTAKLWSGEDLSPLGTLRGHRRGIWSVCFSPTDQVVLTSSADSSIKIWDISGLSCLKTLEGHESSVMRASFLSRGLQIISSGGDGLLKLWSIKTGETIRTFDEHDGKVWALVVTKDENKIITGGSDSKLVCWNDVTEEKQLEKAAKLQQKALQEQELSNLLKSEKLLEALRLALSLERPATVLKIVQDVMDKGDMGLPDTVNLLDESEKLSLIDCAVHWNTNSRYCYAAQVLISILLGDILEGNIKPPRRAIETLISYSEKHYKRLTAVLQDLHIIEYTKLLAEPSSIQVDNAS